MPEVGRDKLKRSNQIDSLNCRVKSLNSSSRMSQDTPGIARLESAAIPLGYHDSKSRSPYLSETSTGIRPAEFILDEAGRINR